MERDADDCAAGAVLRARARRDGGEQHHEGDGGQQPRGGVEEQQKRPGFRDKEEDHEH